VPRKVRSTSAVPLSPLTLLSIVLRMVSTTLYLSGLVLWVGCTVLVFLMPVSVFPTLNHDFNPEWHTEGTILSWADWDAYHWIKLLNGESFKRVVDTGTIFEGALPPVSTPVTFYHFDIGKLNRAGMQSGRGSPYSELSKAFTYV